MPRVKICGNVNYEDAAKAVELGADYIGFIFAEGKRKVDASTVDKIIRKIPTFKNFVGVFYNQPKYEVKQIASLLGLKYLQFHGDETALYCQSFEEEGYHVIKTFRIKDQMSLKRLDEYNVSAFLFDTYSKGEKGGTGIPFDWNLIDDRPYVHEKLFLAGGLNIKNLRVAIEKLAPYAVDVASGVEDSPGKKNYQLIKDFIQIAKQTHGVHAKK